MNISPACIAVIGGTGKFGAATHKLATDEELACDVMLSQGWYYIRISPISKCTGSKMGREGSAYRPNASANDMATH
ncbi:hypothetical protein [Zhongshania marina]|uniref:Uncharacterized protein n=1 Tax=Zhongshania marina TaxID=2304603 RepID=A0ABX9W5Q9_9GAMM|nr:hypothetical protein D0911_04375 [Zhongshania marina]